MSSHPASRSTPIKRAEKYQPVVRKYNNARNPRLNPDRQHYYVGAVMLMRGKKAVLTRHLCEIPRDEPAHALADAEAAILRKERTGSFDHPVKPMSLSDAMPTLPPMKLLMLILPKTEKVVFYHLAKGGTHLELDMNELDPVSVVSRLRSRFLMTDSTAHDIRDLIMARITVHFMPYTITVNAKGEATAEPTY